MRNDIKLSKWKIEADSENGTDDFLESVFFTGNGRMGARGSLSLSPNVPPYKTGLFVAGIFGEIKPGITDFINLPTPLYMKLKADGHTAAPACVHRTLDLHTGLFTGEYLLNLGEKSLKVCEERFFSLSNTGLLVDRIAFKPNTDMNLEISAGVHTACCNLPVADDQTKENTQTVQLTSVVQRTFSENGFSLRLLTKGTNLGISEEVTYHTQGLRCEGTFDDDEGTGLVYRAAVSAGDTVVIEQCAFLSTSRDKDPRIQSPGSEWSFSALLSQNEAAWAEHWESANIEIEGDGQADAALRYLIFEMIANNSEKDPSVNIGARGLTHTRYKGCYFWDTDLFLMPFYLYTNPEAAKNLMQYRTDTLPQAKLYAQKMNSAGARYPWMTSYDGSEQCESWDIGASELHVTADVVYALNQYIDATGDMDFYRNHAAEVYIETARFWQSRYTPDPETGKVNLLFCKGPDEYCGITSNNLYTNRLVKENLRLAVKAAAYLRTNNPSVYRQLGITEEETARWAGLESLIKLPKDPVSGHWKQDDTFDLLEPVNPSELKTGDAASYHKVCFDRLQRYRVIKQADVILLMTRLPGAFTPEEKKAAWNDFEPLCLHDSTLSFATHALFAAQNGITDAAWDYFQKALFLDLRNVMENTGEEGLHAACLGECWQTVVFGFAGLSFENGAPKLSPHLPPSFQKIRFRFFFRGKRYEATVSGSGSSVQIG